MDIYVLNTDFERIGVIDYCESIIWTTRYCDAGDFELYLPATSQAIELLHDGRLLMRSDKADGIMVIKTINISTDAENGNYITVTGRSIESYIGKRIVWKQTNLSGTVTDCITTLIDQNIINPTDQNRKIDGIGIGDYCDCYVSIKKQVTGTNLLEAIINILSTYKLGFRIVLKDILRFQIYKGYDRSYDQSDNPRVIFSPEFDNILQSQYTASTENYKNVAKVAGEGQGVSRKTYVVGDESLSGINRDEIYVDAREISSNTDGGTLTDEEYNSLLAEKGNEALTKAQATESFSGTVEPNTNYIFGKDYFLGDVVNIENEYGIRSKVRIIEVIESWDENGYSCIPTFDTEEV